MSDDNNQKSRGPRKGGGAGGKGSGGSGGGFRGGDGKGRGPVRARSSEGGERPARRFDKPAGSRDGAPRPPRAGGDKPFRARPDGERTPFRARSGDERPARLSSDERPARRFDKPAGQRDGAPRPAREGGERPFRARPEGERPAFRARSGEDRPARDNAERPYRARPEGERSSSRPPREGARSFAKPSFDKPRSERPDRARSGDDRPRRPRPVEDEAPRGVILPSQEPERIAKVMARAGIASRRDSEAMILAGRVSVNGKVIESPALDIAASDVVLIDGEPLPARERTRMWLYHKPRGLVTTNHDPEGRPTVFDALPEDLPRVLSIGRLDINTEGLLLLTNDGGLARMLELPETGWLRRYRVRAFGQVTQDRLDTLRDGVTIEGVAYGPVVARFERQQGANTWLVVDLREGKNREVKTVLEHLGLEVNRLIRVSFGPFQLNDLPEGEADEVRSRVLKDQLGEELIAKAGVDFEAPRRDELPPAPPPTARAPSGDDRPRRRESSAKDGGRTPSQDDRSEKPWKRTVWRDEDAQPQRERRSAPRRGADPREERQTREASGTVERHRDTPIEDPNGRRVLVERVRAPARNEAPRERAAPRERPQRAERNADFGRDRTDERPWQSAGGPDASKSERPARSADGKPRGRSFGDKPAGKGFAGKSSGARGSAGERSGKSFGNKPFGGKPSGGGRPAGGGGRPGAPRGKRD